MNARKDTIDPSTKESDFLHKKDNDEIITIDGSKESTFDEMVARMSTLFKKDDSDDKSKVDEHENASIQPVTEIPAQCNVNDFKDNQSEEDNCITSHYDDQYDNPYDDHYYGFFDDICNGDRSTSRYDDYDDHCNDHYDDRDYEYYDSRYDDSYNNDEFLYGFTDDWEDYYDSVYNQ